MIDNPPPWPDGARMAVAFSFDVDADSVVHASHGAEAIHMPHALAHMRYDPFVGTPRLCKLFAARNVPITCFVPGWVAETYPGVVEAILDNGNELGHHGHFHEWPSRQTAAAERETLERGIEVLTRLSGKRPRGYRAPYYGLSQTTYDLLIELGFAYDSSLFADDIPILLDNGKGRLVEIPVPATIDDYNHYVSSRAFDYLMKVSSPKQALEVYRADFDAMYEFGGLWVSCWHPGVSGRPAQAIAIRELIDYMQEKGDVWFATIGEITDHVNGLIAAGTWSPRVETIPFYSSPVLGGRDQETP
ncbi:polysaccharide deacetylase [Martelella sp. HB161492]|uniref:polysaccharide deacetylase family protein n=1 Tax=Martelella sp. HB161492 TaxID=2720726 RepID=UPI00158FDEFA|nr:polysaccharide deacetylase [Martelella sp. HB161492]